MGNQTTRTRTRTAVSDIDYEYSTRFDRNCDAAAGCSTRFSCRFDFTENLMLTLADLSPAGSGPRAERGYTHITYQYEYGIPVRVVYRIREYYGTGTVADYALGCAGGDSVCLSVVCLSVVRLLVRLGRKISCVGFSALSVHPPDFTNLVCLSVVGHTVGSLRKFPYMIPRIVFCINRTFRCLYVRLLVRSRFFLYGRKGS